MRSIKSACLHLFFLFATFGFSLTPLSAQIEECDNLNKALIEHGNPKFNYHESRNDIGVFYDFEWDSKNKVVIVKRNNDDYPIVRFSLFDKENIFPGTIVKTFNGYPICIRPQSGNRSRPANVLPCKPKCGDKNYTGE